MEKKRERIMTAIHTGTPILDIMKVLKTLRATTFHDKKCLKDSGQEKRKPRSGRRQTVITKKVINIVKSQINRNSIRSMRVLTKDLKISEWTIRNIVKKTSWSLARTSRFLLTECLKSHRLEGCKTLLWILKKNTPFNFFTDEK